MTRRGVGALAASPTLVGAITTLIVILAVFLAYNANNGLPFVPSYRVSVAGAERGDAASRATTCGSAGCGLASSSRSSRCRTRRPAPSTRRSDLKLDKTVDPLPKDSTRDRSLQVGARASSTWRSTRAPPTRATRRARSCRCPRPHPAPGRDRPGPEHVRPGDPARDPGEPGRRSATRWRGAGRT